MTRIGLISRSRKRRLGVIVEGILAGAAGTAAMTAHQELRQRFAGENGRDSARPSPASGEGDPWESAPAPAQVGKRLIEGLGGGPVPAEAIPALTHAMHWSYGSAWGGVYATTRESAGASARLLGPLFGLGVWAASYIQLVPLGIYQPPWCYPLRSIADEIAYHLTFGIAVGATYEVLARRDRA